jgi:hypothetical protein
MSFVPCIQCQRHVRVAERVCPFCSQRHPAGEQLPRLLPEAATRLSRAALVALGATLAGSACGSTVVLDADDPAVGGQGGTSASSSVVSSSSTGNGGAGGVADGGGGGDGGVGAIGLMYGAPATGGFGGDGGGRADLYGSPPPPEDDP